VGTRGSVFFFNFFFKSLCFVQVYIFDDNFFVWLFCLLSILLIKKILLFCCDENMEKVINRSSELGCRVFHCLGCK
jgi:hypothetical protein